MPRKSNSNNNSNNSNNNNNNSDYTQNNNNNSNSNSNCTTETCSSSSCHEDIQAFLREMKLNNANNSRPQAPPLNVSQVDKIIQVLSIVTRQPNLSTLKPINVEAARSVSKNARRTIPEQDKKAIMVSGFEHVLDSYKGKPNTEIRRKLLVLIKKLSGEDALELLFGTDTRHLININEPHILYILQMTVSYFEPKNEKVKSFLDMLSKEEVKKLCYTRCQRGTSIYYRACVGS